MVAEIVLSRRRLLQAAGTAGVALTLGGRPGAAQSPGVSSPSTLAGDITYWHHFSSDIETAGMNAVIETFKAKYPGINLTTEPIPLDSYVPKVTTAVQANGLPDTGMVVSEFAGDLIGIGSLVDITDRVMALPNYGDFPADQWGPVTVDGKIYGVPAYLFVDAMYYRADWFAEAGITKVPETWDEFQAAALALTDPAQGRYGFGMRGGPGGGFTIVQIIESFGTNVLDENGQPALDRDVVIEAIKYYSELFTVHKVAPPSAPSDGFPQITEGIDTGLTGMIFHHTGSLITHMTALGENLGTGIWPGNAHTSTTVSASFNGVMKDDNIDASMAWIAQWTDPEAEIALLTTTGYVPATPAVRDDPRVASNPAYAVAFEGLDKGLPGLDFAGYGDWQANSVLPAFQSVLVGQSTPEQCADTIIETLAQTVG